MCGISGVLDIRSSKDEARYLLRSSIRAIEHRGPDESGFYDGEDASLGMCRLSIIDVAGGHQPNFNEDKSIVTVFNGEIYNFKELHELLKAKGYRLKSYGDSECIPYLYQEFGPDFPKLLQGMFAIAIWDENLKRGVLVRDRFGKKPLWYSHQDNALKFSSELKGLFPLGVKREADTSALGEYLQYGYVNAPRSAYLGVAQVNPGSLLIFQNSVIKEHHYWDINNIEPISCSYPEAKELVHQQLRLAVRDRLVSERPIGSYLSGGIDSSLVTALMTREATGPVHTFTIGLEDGRFDESRYAKLVAKHLGTIHHEKIISPDPKLILETLGKSLDQPFADSSIIPTYLLSKFAREGVVVALGGDGGDEAFGGYTRYAAGNYLDRANPLLALNPSRLLSKYFSSNPRLEKLLRHSKSQNFQKRYSGFQSLVQETELKNILTSSLQTNPIDPHMEVWKSLEENDRIKKMQKMDLRTYLPGDLMYKADMASMANSLELRSPMLDYRVVELGLSLPSKFKVRGLTTKVILKDILYEYVPREIVDRPKMGFGIPRAKWIRNELKPIVEALLFDQTAQNRGWLNTKHLRTTVNTHYKGRDLDRIIWPALMLELWARNWIDAK